MSCLTFYFISKYIDIYLKEDTAFKKPWSFQEIKQNSTYNQQN